MSPHQNRNKNKRALSKEANPLPSQIKDLREGHNLSRREFARIVYSTERAVISWEQGERNMHPGLFELALIKLG
jgi:DNA-binding transcriptional regulator YiaG